ncbi:MAG TPA: hypothetical protein VM692_08480, partial [Gammaproteobacteria bacterium]|nr:hypothetical protein [Gammaproteobacteria bacterium]
MKTPIALVASFTLALQLAHAAPSKEPAQLTGTWTLNERSSDDPVRVLNGERGRGGGRNFKVTTGGSIFGVPVGNLPRPAKDEDDDDDEDEEARHDDLQGAEHVFKATYRLRIRREGDVTEIRYGNDPTI